MERLEKLERGIRRLEIRQKLLEELLPTAEDIKALLEAEEDIKKGNLVPLSKIEKEII